LGDNVIGFALNELHFFHYSVINYYFSSLLRLIFAFVYPPNYMIFIYSCNCEITLNCDMDKKKN